jgi:hypothetical protein
MVTNAFLNEFSFSNNRKDRKEMAALVCRETLMTPTRRRGAVLHRTRRRRRDRYNENNCGGKNCFDQKIGDAVVGGSGRFGANGAGAFRG